MLCCSTVNRGLCCSPYVRNCVRLSVALQLHMFTCPVQKNPKFCPKSVLHIWELRCEAVLACCVMPCFLFVYGTNYGCQTGFSSHHRPPMGAGRAWPMRGHTSPLYKDAVAKLQPHCPSPPALNSCENSTCSRISPSHSQLLSFTVHCVSSWYFSVKRVR